MFTDALIPNVVIFRGRADNEDPRCLAMLVGKELILFILKLKANKSLESERDHLIK